MNTFDQIVQLSYAYFADKKVTPEEIRNFIRRMIIAFPEGHIDKEKLFSKIESIYNVTIDDSFFTLEDNDGHEEWFNVSTNMPIKREFQWHFWDHLKQYLINYKNRPVHIIESLDDFTSEILSRLEDPMRKGTWDRRGMVMGSVQSGKTLNYTALICKAIDAGYKFIVVLTGIHNSLRSQTQDRLNEELLGYDLDRIQRLTGQERRIGVRKMFPDHRTLNTLTSSSQQGDFNRVVSAQAGIFPSLTGDPIILIVKKNVTILKHLISWLNSLPGTVDIDGRKAIMDVPLLLIDDECDYASVDTGQPERDEEGNINPEYDPKQTNKNIRKLLFTFQKKVYIGYTATPYANIFIHDKGFHLAYGEDLFPRHFIISLPQPTNYVGPEYIFGIKGDSGRGIESVDPLPVVRYIADHSEIIPDTHKSHLTIVGLPESMSIALKCFLLVCAERRIRKEGTVHNSMLIHVTRFRAVQKQIKDLVEKELRKLVARIMSGSDLLLDFKKLWEDDFVPTSLAMNQRGFKEAILSSWDEIKKRLFVAVKVVKVKGINGEIGDVLDYREADAVTRERIHRGEEVPWEERGISVIAVGGDKLSRGLTLDGLSISYYLRASKMYDTLMQMGRWFGYRKGYNDLCRIITTEELSDWYSHIALANQELRNDLEYMALINSKPEEFGLKVRSHPGRLAITSAGKSRNAERLSISYEGEFPKTIVFDPRESRRNFMALENLISQIGRDVSRNVNQKSPRFHWEDVDPSIIVNFLRTYKTQESMQRTVNPPLIADFIEKQVKRDRLTNWHVVIVSNSDNNVHRCNVGKYTIGCVERKPRKYPSKELISIGTLTSPADESLDLEDKERLIANKFDKDNHCARSDGNLSSISIRHARSKSKALLLIYLPVYENEKDPLMNYGLSNEEIVGFAISFPKDKEAIPVEYWVHPIHKEQY